ncbi:MAG: zf-HC2 domain-containing protein [Victivallales bacterium]|nr:zf-HC2 domain-containing protein [Victivallales bacterium]
MGHISEIEMGRYLDGTLSMLGRMMVKHHLSNCPKCAKELEELKKDRDDLKMLSGLIGELDDADTKSFSVTSESVTSYFNTENKEEDET